VVDDEFAQRLATLESCTDTDVLVKLGCELATWDRLEDAERCFRRAIDLGSTVALFDLGNTLAERHRWSEAIATYERAIALGDTGSWLNLGHVLQEVGDLGGAMRAFREASEAGDSEGTLALAFSLREQGELDQAEDVARRAAEAGNLQAVGVLACWRWDRTLEPALETDLRAGADHFPSARADLADLLHSTGRTAEARVVLERGAQLGEKESWLPLGNLYADEFGDNVAAEAAYRSGIDSGDAHCHLNLGVLLEERGDVEGAERHFRLAVAAGDSLAATALRRLLDDEV